MYVSTWSSTHELLIALILRYYCQFQQAVKLKQNKNKQTKNKNKKNLTTLFNLDEKKAQLT